MASSLIARLRKLFCSILLLHHTQPAESHETRREDIGTGTNATLDIALKNNTNSSSAYAYITGRASDGSLVLMQADGKTPYYPTSPASEGAELVINCAIPLGAPGTTTTITIPQISGGRIWFSIGDTLTFLLNPGPNLVEPSINPADPNHDKIWDFCEFTFNAAQLYVNITYVDFVCLPIALSLTNTAGAIQRVTGMPSSSLDSIVSQLRAQHALDNAGWDSLIVESQGKVLRALSPSAAIGLTPTLFSGYYDKFVQSVWTKYTSTKLCINTQNTWGTLSGQVVNDVLTFPNGGSFTRPSTADIFSCSTGPFVVKEPVQGSLVARIAAAFNRSTLLLNTEQPNKENPATYYSESVTNHYARIVHAANQDGRGYSFPYDDVAPDGGVDQSGAVYDTNPALLTVTLGSI